MNKILIIISFLIGLSSCSVRYKINGESSLSQLEGKKLFLKTIMPDGDMLVVDSSEVIHGIFVMKGKIDSVQMAMLYMDDVLIMPLVLEKGHIKIAIDKALMQAKGTPLNNKLYDFFHKKNLLDERADELERREANLIMNGESPEYINAEMGREEEKLSKEMNSLVKGFISDNYENVLGPGIFVMLTSSYPVISPLMENVYTESPTVFKNNPLVKTYMSAIKDYEQRMKGEKKN